MRYYLVVKALTMANVISEIPASCYHLLGISYVRYPGTRKGARQREIERERERE